MIAAPLIHRLFMVPADLFSTRSGLAARSPGAMNANLRFPVVAALAAGLLVEVRVALETTDDALDAPNRRLDGMATSM